MCFSHLGVFLISVIPLTTENTENKTTPNICKITVHEHKGNVFFLQPLQSNESFLGRFLQTKFLFQCWIVLRGKTMGKFASERPKEVT